MAGSHYFNFLSWQEDLFGVDDSIHDKNVHFQLRDALADQNWSVARDT